MQGSTDSPQTSPAYAKMRGNAQSMTTKVLIQADSLGFSMVKAAKFLGIPTPGNTIVFTDESDFAMTSDYLMAELRIEGRSLAETCDPVELELTPGETHHLEAFQHSYTSLFRPTGTVVDKHQILFQDMLNPDRPEVALTDTNLSQSMERRGREILLFLRVLEVEGFFISSGAFLPFPVPVEDRLIQSYRQKMKKISQTDWSARSMIFFFKKHRQWGELGTNADVL